MKPMFRLALATFFLGALASCSKTDNGEGEVVPPRVMVLHASPDAPAVDIRVNNQVAVQALAFPSNTPYVAVNAGSNNVKVSPAGTNVNVIDANLNFEGGKVYSVFAIDSVSKLKAAVLEDNLATPAAGKAHLRFLHFSPNAPAVDIAVTGGPVLFANRAFNDQSANTSLSAFTPVDAGTYNLEVRLAGTNTVVLALPNVAVTAGKIYTVFARGNVGGTGAQALGAQVIANN
ncbi:protein of unknown function [Cnuella takakiae]|uniref:DUF4397 domain-containing protein n=1 Tax=Cnuella takakiae TaxID=1302690 RepID=A0A1M4Y603_9BACT|nr:DUF4397 domain-containing protein [Cnuella takakiae]OLY93060.1 cell wall anchor protein [Cnuella takakiae]SHF01237.1 protein of unknown function [Cnuella takakiae]